MITEKQIPLMSARYGVMCRHPQCWAAGAYNGFASDSARQNAIDYFVARGWKYVNDWWYCPQHAPAVEAR